MVASDCHCCSERKLLRMYLEEFRRKGIDLNQFPRWLHRKYGNLIIWRPRKDGVMGTSLPCVVCRKAIEKYRIQWVAYDGDKWIHSNHDDPPQSKPTHKQRKLMGFS